METRCCEGRGDGKIWLIEEISDRFLQRVSTDAAGAEATRQCRTVDMTAHPSRATSASLEAVIYSYKAPHIHVISSRIPITQNFLPSNHFIHHAIC